jgi:hypothetical protein
MKQQRVQVNSFGRLQRKRVPGKPNLILGLRSKLSRKTGQNFCKNPASDLNHIEKGGTTLMFQGGSLWAGLASGAMSQFQDTKNFTQGTLDRNEYAVKTASNVKGKLE